MSEFCGECSCSGMYTPECSKYGYKSQTLEVAELRGELAGWERRCYEAEKLHESAKSMATAEVEKMQDQIDELRNTYVPQENVMAMMARLTAAGYDVPGRSNTLWAMVLSVCEDVEKLRSANQGAAMFRDKLDEMNKENNRLKLDIRGMLKKILDVVQSGSAPAETLPGESATARSPLPSPDEKTMDVVLNYVRANPGTTAHQVAKALGEDGRYMATLLHMCYLSGWVTRTDGTGPKGGHGYSAIDTNDGEL